MKYFELNKQEEQIIADFDKGNLISVDKLKEEKAKYQSMASFTLNKTKNINLRLSEKVVHKLKVKAIQQGVPYQTLAASVLHRYSNTV
jgi:predicted DNA binding CopG/RHH family protein